MGGVHIPISGSRLPPRREDAPDAKIVRTFSSRNTYNLKTWFQSKLLHVYFNVTTEYRYVQ